MRRILVVWVIGLGLAACGGGEGEATDVQAADDVREKDGTSPDAPEDGLARPEVVPAEVDGGVDPVEDSLGGEGTADQPEPGEIPQSDSAGPADIGDAGATGDTATDAGLDAGGGEADSDNSDAIGPGDAEAAEDASDSDVDSDIGGGDTGWDTPDVPPEEQQKAAVDLSTTVVRKAKFGETLVVGCRTVNGLGLVVPDPGQYVVTVSAADMQSGEQGYSFPTPGVYQATCTDEANGLSASAEFVVAHELVAPGLSAIAGEIPLQAVLVQAGIDAAQGDDVPAVEAAMADLADSRQNVSVQPAALVLTPPGGWPSKAKLAEKCPAAADDGAYVALAAQLKAGALDMVAETQALVTEPSLAGLSDLAAKNEAVRLLLVQMDKLSPGALGYYDSIDSWEAAVQAVQEAQEAQTLLIEDMLLHPEEWVDKPCPGCFTLTELMVNVAISYILDSIPTYSGLLKDAGKAAASMAIMVAIADAINSAFPPGPGAPVIEYITPGYGNAVNDGASLSLFGGGFDYWAGNNVVIFIGPSVADSAVNAVDLAMSAMDAIKALQDWENVWELANALTDAFGALNDTLDFLSGDIPNLLKTGVVPLPVLKVSPFLDDQDFWQQIIDLPPLPEVNDSWLPKAGILIPISFSRGNGAAYKIVILP